jgi:hypothetical protein
MVRETSDPSAEDCGGSKRTTSSLMRRSLLRAMAKDSMLIMLNSVKEASGDEAGPGADWTVHKNQILVHRTLYIRSRLKTRVPGCYSDGVVRTCSRRTVTTGSLESDAEEPPSGATISSHPFRTLFYYGCIS